MTEVNHPSDLIPRDKGDEERVERLFTVDPCLVEPVLYEIMTWCADGNWPIARRVLEYLETVGARIIRHVPRVLDSREADWISHVLGVVETVEPEATLALRKRLSTLSQEPDEYDNDILAMRLLSRMPGCDRDALAALVRSQRENSLAVAEALSGLVDALGPIADDRKAAWRIVMERPSDELDALHDATEVGRKARRGRLCEWVETITRALADPDDAVIEALDMRSLTQIFVFEHYVTLPRRAFVETLLASRLRDIEDLSMPIQHPLTAGSEHDERLISYAFGTPAAAIFWEGLHRRQNLRSKLREAEDRVERLREIDG